MAGNLIKLGFLAAIIGLTGLVGYQLLSSLLHTEQNVVAASPSPVNSVPSSSPIPSSFTLLVTGDVLTARTVNQKNTNFNDFTWPFHQTAEVLRQADITFINLETPLTRDCQPRIGGMIFCGSPRNIEGLLYAGVDLVNLANNHMGNQGQTGVDETVAFLDGAGIAHTGVKNPTWITLKGSKVAFLGYNEVDNQVGITRADTEVVRTEIQAARQAADIVIVQFHWGAEYQYQPTTNQQRLAHLAVESGADLVLGNHPHWWQPPELYQGKYIMYSHGNFVFDQMWSAETREGLVGLYTFEGNQLSHVEFLPVIIEDYGQPRWLVGEEKQAVLERLTEEQRKLSVKTKSND